MRGKRPGLTEVAHHRGARAGRTLSGRGAKPSGSYAIQYFLRAVDRLHPPAGHWPAYSLETNCDVHETQHSTQVKTRWGGHYMRHSHERASAAERCTAREAQRTKNETQAELPVVA